MSHPRAGWVFAAATLVICVLAGGCQSTSGSVVGHHGHAVNSKAVGSPNAFVLAQGMDVEWQIKPTKADANQILKGHSVVGPDGKIEMGPYGPCLVGGLTLPKATVALEKHLSRYIHGPAVSLSTQTPVPPAGDIAWKPARSPAAGASFASNGKKDMFFPVGFEPDKEGPNLGGTDKDKKDLEVGPAPRPLTTQHPKGLLHYAGPYTGSPIHDVASEGNLKVLPPYVIGPTDVLQIESLEGLKTQTVRGPHLVGPDGAVRVGIYGPVAVAGLTLDQAKSAIAQTIHARLNEKEKTLKDVMDYLSVDVLAYNSKVFYIITDGGGQGEQVIPLPVTGNDTVLNAMAKVGGLPAQSSKFHVWVARATAAADAPMIFPVDWVGVTQRGSMATNWQVMPGDRIYVHSDPWIRASTRIGKMLSPLERIMGAMLLGSQTANSIKTGTVGGVR